MKFPGKVGIQMGKLQTRKTTQFRAVKHLNRESKDAGHRSLRNDRLILGDQKRSIIDSIQKHFAALTPKEVA
jgi:hypothetical protein